MENQLFFADLFEWREWLSKNHNKVKFIWMIYYKKHTKMKCISRKDALQEALCWGWIDSLVKRIDDDRYVLKFTPRTNHNKWSEVNKQHIRELLAANRMTEFGLAKVDLKLLHEKSESKKELSIPEYVVNKLKKHEKAKIFFDQLAPSHQRTFIGWIDSAKREETKLRRLALAIDLLNSGKKLGMK